MSDNKAEFNLLVPFWIDTDGYSERDREMFVCGVEYIALYNAVTSGLGWNQCIHAENESRVRLLCGRLGLRVTMKRECDTWTHCEIPSK